MAYGAILGQMPQIDGIPAVIETYPIATGNTITQGDVVDVVDGQIQKTLTPQANVETTIEKLAWAYTKTEKISASKLAIMSDRASATPPLNVCVFDVSTEGIISNIKSSDVIGDIIPYNNVNACSFSVISEEKIVVFYNQSTNKIMRAKVCTVNENNTLSLGNARATEEFSDFPSVIESIFLDNDTIIVFSNDSGLNARICTISGTTPTWASSTYRLSGNTSASYISATRLPDSGTTRRVCVCYSDGGDSNKGKAVIVSIDGSNNVTWGSPVVFATSIPTTYNSPIAVASYSENCVVAYSNAQDGNKLYACVLSVSGTAISLGNNNLITSSGFSGITLSTINGNFIASGQLGGSGVTGVSCLISSEASSLGNGYTYNNAGTYYNSSSAISDNTVLIAYSDGGNSNYGTATILTVEGNQIAGSFLDSAKDAIALQSGTSGQSIEVIYSGIANADWVTAGQTITSDGVYGAGVLDGVLQVWSKDRPGGVIETGSYVGTGTYGVNNPNSITFTGKPKIVIVCGSNVFALFCQGDQEAAGIAYPYHMKESYSLTGNNLSWYCSGANWGNGGLDESAYYQLNSSGKKYYYVAIG